MRTRVALWWVLAGAAVVSLLVAQLAGARGGAEGGTLRVNISESDVQTLDPAIDYEFFGGTLLFHTCAKLVFYPDKNGAAGARLVPDVAAAMPKVGNGGKTYTFRLRKGFRFNTGEAVTAASFARAFERDLTPKMQSPGASFLGEVVGAEAMLKGKANRVSGVTARGNTLTIRLTRPAPDFLARLTMNFFCAVPADLPIDPKGVPLPPMAGPYYFVAREPGRSITLARNPFYGGSRPHHVERIQVSVNTSLNTSYLEVEKGAADLDLAGIPTQQNGPAAKKYGVNKGRYWAHPALAVNYIALNTRRGPFADLAVRKAANYAVDRNAISRLEGVNGAVPTDQILPPGLRGHKDARIYPSAPNLARARTLMAGRTAKVALYTSSGVVTEQQAQIVKANLQQIGIDVTVKALPFGVLVGKVTASDAPYDMVMIGWFADYADPYDFIDVLLNGSRISARNNQNLALFDDPAFNKRMDAAARLSGPARYAAYARLDAQIMRQAAPWIPFDVPTVRELVSARVACYVYPPPFGLLSLSAACLK